MPFWLKVAVFAVAGLALFGGSLWWTHRHAGEALQLGRRGRRILGWSMGLFLLAMILGRLGGRVPGLEGLALPLGMVGSMGILAAFLSFPGLLAVDAARAAAWVGRRFRRLPSGASREAPPSRSRRTFLARSAQGAALAAGSTASTYGTLFGRHDYQVEDVIVRVPHLPKALEGLTIAQLSDIHFGAFVGERERRAAEAMVQKVNPDVIVLTGDLVDHDPSHAAELGKLVRNLSPMARHGVVAIAGNHDHYAGVHDVLSAIRQAGGRVLDNEHVWLGNGSAKVALLGVDDVWATRLGGAHGPDLTKAIGAVPEDAVRVLLCHNPEYFPEAAPHVDVQLSGHTHGGQIAFGVNPADLVLPHGFVAGVYRRSRGTLYVNRGFGTAGPPSRIGAPPEVTRVVLTT